MNKKSLILLIGLALCLESMQTYAAKKIVEEQNKIVVCETGDNDVDEKLEQNIALKINGTDIELMQPIQYYIDKGLMLSEIENNNNETLKHYKLNDKENAYVFDSCIDTDTQIEMVFCIQILSTNNKDTMVNNVKLPELNDQVLQNMFGECNYSFDIDDDRRSDSYYSADGTKIRVIKNETKIETIEISKKL